MTLKLYNLLPHPTEHQCSSSAHLGQLLWRDRRKNQPISKKGKKERELPERFCSVESFVLEAVHCKEKEQTNVGLCKHLRERSTVIIAISHICHLGILWPGWEMQFSVQIPYPVSLIHTCIQGRLGDKEETARGLTEQWEERVIKTTLELGMGHDLNTIVRPARISFLKIYL